MTVTAETGAEAAVVPQGTRRPPRPTGGRRRRRLPITPWLFLVPALLLGVLFKFYPMVEGLRMSLMRVQPFLGDIFIGLDNYEAVLTDQRFLDAIGHTLFLAVVSTLGAVVVGAVLALLLEGQTRRLYLVRTGVFLPVVTALAVTGEIWRIIYFPTESGFLNSILGVFGIPAQAFLSDPSTSLFYVAVVGIWTGAPYNMVIILAGLTGVDRSLYEAAAIDGASTRHRLRYIVLPALRPAIAVVLTLAAIRSLRSFTEIYVLTGGGPAGSTEVWMTRTFSLGFDSNNFGVASAASVILLLATLILTLAVRIGTRRKENA